MEDRDRLEDLLREVDPGAAEQAAAVGSQAFRMLPGEGTGSPDQQDAEHWPAVYDELERFTDELLGTLPEAITEAPDRSLHECAEDERLLRATLERLRAHRRYWEEFSQRSA